MTHYGLSNDAVQARLRQYGPNALPERPPTPLWRRFARQFQSPLIYHRRRSCSTFHRK